MPFGNLHGRDFGRLKSVDINAVSDLTLEGGGLKVSPLSDYLKVVITSISMKIASPFAAVALTGWIVSCTPTPEEAPPTPPSDVAQNLGASADKPAADEMTTTGQASSQADEMKKKSEEERETITENVEDPKPSAPTTKAAVPVARRVPGREGFVFSPYNNKMINVKDFASGTMVADPTYPPAEKKYFRVP
jgi:hypothetical protein